MAFVARKLEWALKLQFFLWMGLVSVFGVCRTSSAFVTKPTALFVDKKTNRLHVCEWDQGQYKIIKTYHTTLGRVSGDKEDEDDLKTPEGIYLLTSMVLPPQLQKKFGVMGLNLNFPNPYDYLAGRTGSGIMLHATNEPERLKKNYDSQGCIVVHNQEILEIKSHIRLGLTPILIFAEMLPSVLAGDSGSPLKIFFEQWIQHWEKKEVGSYISDYHSDFSAQGKDKNAWKVYKSQLAQRYSSIEIHPETVLFYHHPKYSMITFTQNYRSKLKSGSWGHRSRGTKTLYIAEESGFPKIIAETFSTRVW